MPPFLRPAQNGSHIFPYDMASRWQGQHDTPQFKKHMDIAFYFRGKIDFFHAHSNRLQFVDSCLSLKEASASLRCTFVGRKQLTSQ